MQSRREKFRKGLSGLYLPFYDALCGELPAEWEPYQGMRSFSYQQSLYTQGRTSPGPGAHAGYPLGRTVTNARAGESPHNYGCATDWTIWKDDAPVWLGEEDYRWQAYWNACDKIGVKKGADFGDKPHNELLIDASWKHDVLPLYQEKGFFYTEAFLKKKMIK